MINKITGVLTKDPIGVPYRDPIRFNIQTDNGGMWVELGHTNLAETTAHILRIEVVDDALRILHSNDPTQEAVPVFTTQY